MQARSHSPTPRRALEENRAVNGKPEAQDGSSFNALPNAAIRVQGCRPAIKGRMLAK
jgi:hypothetical protein